MTTTNEMTNFMGEKSFKLFNPLNRLKMVAFSSFLGEPTYYQPIERDEAYIEDFKTSKKRDNVFKELKDHLLVPTDMGVSRNTTFYNAVNSALDFDFGKTLELAVQCRNVFFMRRSTAQILAVAAAHPQRVEFNENNPKLFRDILVKCWLLPGDAIACLDAWKALFGSKSKFPSFIKRAYEDRLNNLSAYQQEKYRKETISMVRLAHPSKSTLKKNDSLRSLMSDGRLELDDKDIKWETLRSLGKNWLETLEAMEWHMPHMAALRNIRGFAGSDPGMENMTRYLEMLLSGVKGGKQFPFRYITAYEQMRKMFDQSAIIAVTAEDEESNIEEQPTNKKMQKTRVPVVVSIEYRDIIVEYLEKCLQMSIENYPELEGDVISLCDNSGSAHGTISSAYGTQTVANIGNLSGLLTAYRATGRGVVGIFGDYLKLYEVDKSRPLLEQYSEINALGGEVGGGTENGVWLFFKMAFQTPSSYKFDHWFCYSDMQVGHGGLYGNDPEIKSQGFVWGNKYGGSLYIDIHKCVDKYRMEINPRLNTYMVQTAGYDNTILPETTYRGAILAGWTGNEVVYANQLCRLWDELESV